MPAPDPRILVIEDEQAIRKFLRAILTAHGYAVVEATTAREGLLQAGMQPPDVILLDLGLPDQDGLTVTRQLREWTRVPIIVLSARGMENDKIAALDAGADDYLTKPFGVGELTARIRVALRHANSSAQIDGDPTHQVGDLIVDLSKRTVSLRGQDVQLTPNEFRLLGVLARHAGKVLTHSFLLNEVWGPSHTHDTQYLRVYMGQLRRKLEDDAVQPRYLLTVPGVGYRLAEQ